MQIPHNKPSISEAEEKAVIEALRSGWLAYGERSKEAEESPARHLDAEGRAIMVSSGTAALFLALKALGLSRGDKVIVPTYTCTAVLNAVYMAGLSPLLCDIDTDLNLSPEDAARKLDSDVKTIIITHTFGYPAKTDEFLSLGLPVIEDCATALGSLYRGKPVGSTGALSIFSFYASKVITGGYGGAVYTKDTDMYDFIKDYVNFDMPEVYNPGFNFMISDINSSVISAQLKKLQGFIERRMHIADIYKESFKGYFNVINKHAEPNYYRFLLDLGDEQNALKFIKYMESKDIRVIRPIKPFELLHNYLKLDGKEFVRAEDYSTRIVSLPIFPSLSEVEIDRVVASVKGFYSA